MLESQLKKEGSFLWVPESALYTFGMGCIAVLKQQQAGEHTLALECGSSAGYVLSALRHGIKTCRFTGPEAVLKKLQGIAQQYDACVMGA